MHCWIEPAQSAQCYLYACFQGLLIWYWMDQLECFSLENTIFLISEVLSGCEPLPHLWGLSLSFCCLLSLFSSCVSSHVSETLQGYLLILLGDTISQQNPRFSAFVQSFYTPLLQCYLSLWEMWCDPFRHNILWWIILCIFTSFESRITVIYICIKNLPWWDMKVALICGYKDKHWEYR